MSNSSSKSYSEQPCERCGSKKLISKSKIEIIETASGKSKLEVSEITCSNKECQELFEKNREQELVKINERNLLKAEHDRVRRENIDRAVAERRSNRFGLKLKK